MNNDNSIISEFMKNTVRKLTVCLKSSLELPVTDHADDGIFNEYPQYKKVLNGLSLKVLNDVQHLIDKQDGKGNLLDSAEKKGIDEKFNILVEVNDRLLDKCNDIINSIENPNATKPSDMIVLEYSISQIKLPQDGTKMTPKQTIRLLSSVQVERPQLKFSKPVDNSKVPFRPILTKKPNAIKSLEDSLVNNAEDNEDDYPHPYQTELDQFETPAEQFDTPLNPEFPKPLDQTPYEFIDTHDKLHDMVTRLKHEREIAVDLEHHSVRTYFGLTCLIQLSTRSADFVIDALALHDYLEILNEIFTDSKIVKVFHGSNSDLMWLQRDCGVYVINMFDTGLACTAMNLARKSLSFLLNRYCQIEANKEFQRLTDWRVRPLIDELIEYARIDTHYLLYIYDRMRSELNDRQLLQNVFQSSKQMCYTLYHKPTSASSDCIDVYRRSSESFDDRQLHALHRLWELRDQIARDEDESAPFVLPNRLLLAIAQALPRDTAGVLACCSQDWKLPLVRKYAHDFVKICIESYSHRAGTNPDRADTSTPRRNIVEFLLAKHDRSGPSDRDQIDLQLDPVDIESKMKIESNHVPIIAINKSAVPSIDMATVRLYLKHHSMKREQIVPDSSLVSTEPDHQSDGDEAHDSVESDVEIVDSKTVPTVDQSMDSVDTETSIKKTPAKRPIGPSDSDDSVDKKARTVVPFDYETSLKQLQQAGNSGQKGKQFQPFATKKFKKNQRGKKH